MKIYMLGDVHGATAWTIQQIEKASETGCNKLFQVGDWGLQFPGYDKFHNKVNNAATQYGIDVYFIRGNHDGTDVVKRYCKDLNDDGFHQVYSNIYYIPDGTCWKWDDVSFLAVGGAISVDKAWRVPGTSWWPDEGIQQDTIYNIEQMTDSVDILITHDGPTAIKSMLRLPNLNDQNLELECYAHSMVVNDIIKKVQPKIHLFGHYHESARWDNYGVDTILLNNEYKNGSSAILDLEQLREKFGTMTLDNATSV